MNPNTNNNYINKKTSTSPTTTSSDVDFCENAIEVNNLSFSYSHKTPIIKNVSFKIKKNTYVSILGHNGSGKSTIAKLLLGILTPNEGEIKIFNSDIIKQYNKAKKHIGVVFQNPDNQFIGSTVQDDIAFGLENTLVPQNKMMPIIKKVSKIVGMENFLDSEPHRLSGGQKQRVAIASTLALNSDIIVFDESTSMLDPKAKIDIKKLMRTICDENKKTVISITHDMDEAQNSDFLLVLNKGTIMFHGTPKEIFKNHEKLWEIGLDVPLSLKISLGIQKENTKFKICQSEKDLESEICKLILKK